MKALFSLKGRTALVTGSSRGIGKGILLGLAAHGADVVVHYAGANEEAEESAEAAREFGVRAFVVKGDLGVPGGPRQVFRVAEEALGRVDILVQNVANQVKRPWQEITRDDFDYQVNLNLWSTVELIQCALPGMMQRKWGRILTVGSVQQVKPHPQMLIYAGIKSAIVNMVRNLAKQVAGSGVTVNNLAPGVILTDRNVPFLGDESYRKQILDRIPAARFGQIEDCAGAAVLLCSEAGGYITGVDLLADGGMHLG